MPYPEKKLLAQSLLLILAVRTALWILPFNLLNRWLKGASPVANKAADWDTIKRVVGSVRSVSRLVPYATCLTQALATRVLLRMVGQSSDLRIGVERDQNEKFGAHAWIEVDGRIVIGKLPHHRRFAVLNSN
ncbi:MAG: lasso peptide biosynthesis B2 protein [Acidobacteria bacterium]|nr:lasso peptide biosynthesis B2 protein [Acidobacteriota bacterium]